MKRTFDIFASAIAILVALLFMVVIAIAIAVTSGRPIFFTQKRTGRYGKPFTILKFRTMKWQPNAPFVRCTNLEDPRIAGKVGRFLRRTKLDELPQFFNVLKGDMSIFGWRPYEVSMDQGYAETVGGYTDRYAVKPGIWSWSLVLSDTIEEEVRRDTRKYGDNPITATAVTSRSQRRFTMNTTVHSSTTLEEAKLARSQHFPLSRAWRAANKQVRELRNAAWDAFGHGVEGRRDRECY